MKAESTSQKNSLPLSELNHETQAFSSSVESDWKSELIAPDITDDEGSGVGRGCLCVVVWGGGANRLVKVVLPFPNPSRLY